MSSKSKIHTTRQSRNTEGRMIFIFIVESSKMEAVFYFKFLFVPHVRTIIIKQVKKIFCWKHCSVLLIQKLNKLGLNQL